MTEKNTESDALILPPPAESDSLLPQDNEEEELSLLDQEFIVDNILHGRKMTNALFEFIEPYYDSDKHDEESLKQLLSLAKFAWNLSFEPKKQQSQQITRFSAAFIGHAKGQAAVKSLIQSMIVRRKRYFAHIKRLIIGFEVEDHEDEINLAVVSEPI